MNRLFSLIFLAIFLPFSMFSQSGIVETDAMDDATPGVWRVVAGGGVAIPFEPGNFDDYFKPGYSFGGGLTYAFSPGDVGYGEVSLTASYYNLSFDDAGFVTANNLPGTAVVYGYPGDVFSAMVGFRGVFATSVESVAPFFTMGVGMFHIALPQMGVENVVVPIVEEYKKTTFGWSVGLGVDVPVTGNFTFFVDGRFLLGTTETNGHKLFTAGGGLRVKI